MKMELEPLQQSMLDGEHGKATQKAMQILNTLGTIYGAEEMIPVTSVQVAGVSYANLGEAGLQFLSEMADGGGRARVLTTLNPAGMDMENWQALGIPQDFARNQERVLEAFGRMQVITTCSCTPYLFGNTPHFGEHIAWAESSAVCYANAVLGARTNREGGPSALAASLTGFTPAYGMHLEENRRPTLTIEVEAEMPENHHFGALGKCIGEKLEGRGKRPVPYITGIRSASMENLKSFCASIATYGGTALFHIPGITPEAERYAPPDERITIGQAEIDTTIQNINDPAEEVDFVSLGCPHLSIREIARIAELLEGKKVTKEFWITTARPTKQIADRAGYTQVIEEAGAKFAADTCCVVAPIKGRFKTLVTDSAKACYYGCAKNDFKIIFKAFDEVVLEATK
ncbi:MAG: aconitase X catalytic domain-containing protein [Anaerolineaceae bacterium]|nr:aconitase X catalytic domain-containing protein [Anaerolineaceae bacterium]